MNIIDILYKLTNNIKDEQTINELFIILNNLCKDIMLSWPAIRNKFLINCHDDQPTTDIVYALALKIQDPLCEKQVKYEWFNFMHNKNAVNGLTQAYTNDQYLYPTQIDEKIYVGGYRQSRIFHYYNKLLPEELLFGETHGLVLISLREEDIMEFERICMNIGVPCTTIGRVTNTGRLTFNDLIDISTVKLKNIYEKQTS